MVSTRRAASVFGRRFAVGGFISRHDGEFVTSEAGDEVAAAHAQTQPRGHQPQQFVSRGMSQSVVDLLEAIEIETKQGEPGTYAGLVNRRRQMFLQHHAIGQAGQEGRGAPGKRSPGLSGAVPSRPRR